MGYFLGQENMILSHNETNYGKNKVTFGTGEVDIMSKRDELWDRTWSLFGTGLTYGHNKTNFGTE